MSVLDQIIEHKRTEVDRLRIEHDPDRLKESAREAPSPRDFTLALNRCTHVPIIAEIKRVSPSQGRLRDLPDPEPLARSYERAGAAAISVLTDGKYFGGDLGDVRNVRRSVGLPILRKDFIIDALQIYESRAAGADAILLIVAALTDSGLHSLYEEALDLRMTPLVEVHSESELERALELDPAVIGINSRNLKTLEVDLSTARRLRPSIPPAMLAIAESGIHSRKDVEDLLEAGFDAFLIGTALMSSNDPAATLADLCRARG